MDLDEKVFVFPKPSSNSYVQLKPHLPEPLRQFTVCLSFYTDLPREFALLSCASRNRDNEILLLKHSPTVYNIYVGGNNHSYIVTGNTDRGYHWENVCVAWSLTTGIVQLFLDGMALPRKGLSKDYAITTDLVMMLGQDQDSYGGSLAKPQSFVGEITDVYMWDSVLPPQELRRIWRKTVPAPVLNWTALNFEIKGYVVLEPSLD
ncbi:LOW QUALITY PROTEIN: serum amyloid P-component-like [Sphaerodactylus townsendi]|uniref:LOW QUALITY PROTEIN: serum amyloid P-component-like n=1 Tax=Sphaerodactylus townsendi TaxID=933632 RepID=UPI002026189C|nr:LOW QUALITY PROTEIN: serum amyloid P-component-like [Sphaerodactylus townsendi]